MSIQRKLLFPGTPTSFPLLSRRHSNLSPAPPATTQVILPPESLDAPSSTILVPSFQSLSLHDPARYYGKTFLAPGANSTVFQAFDTKLQRPVAIKSFCSDSLAAKTPVQLANLSSVTRVQHSHVVSTYDLGHDENGSYIAMELVQGETLNQISKRTLFDLNRFQRFARQSIEGVHAIHQAGVLHLGIKPSNIMLSNSEVTGLESTKIVGFSRAQAMDFEFGNIGHIIGANSDIRCTAPELLSCAQVTEKTDLYSLGCCFYRALTQKYPFGGADVMQLMSSHIHNFVQPLGELRPDLPTWLTEWTMSLISNNPNNRPSVTQAMETLIQQTRYETA